MQIPNQWLFIAFLVAFIDTFRHLSAQPFGSAGLRAVRCRARAKPIVGPQRTGQVKGRRRHISLGGCGFGVIVFRRRPAPHGKASFIDELLMSEISPQQTAALQRYRVPAKVSFLVANSLPVTSHQRHSAKAILPIKTILKTFMVTTK